MLRFVSVQTSRVNLNKTGGDGSFSVVLMQSGARVNSRCPRPPQAENRIVPEESEKYSKIR